MGTSLKSPLPWLPRRSFRASLRAMRMLAQPSTPLLTQLVVTRRCNLSCGYCNEYDDYSDPIPTDELIRRVDHVAKLGNLVITLTGGEPLLHPELDRVVARAVSHGMVCTSISNAYPITPTWTKRLNRAGLSLLQVSVDNIEPNEVSQKSWSKIKKRLEVLKEHAEFKVNINAVLGSCNADQTRRLATEIRDLGFFMTVGLLHDESGQIENGLLGDALPRFYEEFRGQRNRSFFHRFGEGWEEKMLAGGESPWRCRAGARYLYIDEFGKVSYCSQRRGEPGIPILEYGRKQLREAFDAPKGCEKACTIACVRRASSLDEWRPQRGKPILPRPSEEESPSDGRLHLPTI